MTAVVMVVVIGQVAGWLVGYYNITLSYIRNRNNSSNSSGSRRRRRRRRRRSQPLTMSAVVNPGALQALSSGLLLSPFHMIITRVFSRSDDSKAALPWYHFTTILWRGKIHDDYGILVMEGRREQK